MYKRQLKNYVEDLQDNLKKMGEQIGLLRGQIRKLKTIQEENSKAVSYTHLCDQQVLQSA